jgi:hypothetical protein
MAPKRKAAASQPRATRQRVAASALAADSAVGPVTVKRVRRQAATKASAVPSAAPRRAAATRHTGGRIQSKPTPDRSTACSAAAGPSAASAAGPGGATTSTRKVDEHCDTGIMYRNILDFDAQTLECQSLTWYQWYGQLMRQRPCWSAAGVEVVGDYDCMLNQTNIGANNNKFYK